MATRHGMFCWRWVTIVIFGLAAWTTTAAAAAAASGDYRCFTGITTLSGTAGDVNSPTNPCPGGYCAADWQLAFDPQTGQVGRFAVSLGPHQVDVDTLYAGDSVEQVTCSTDNDAGLTVLSIRSGYQTGATTFVWRYDATQVSCADVMTSPTLSDQVFRGMTLDIVVLDVGSWSSANADVQPLFSLQSFETGCAAISFDEPPSEYCYRVDDIVLSPQGNDPYVASFYCSDASVPCVASLAFCLDAATQSEITQLSVTLDDAVCVSNGIQDTLDVSCIGDLALLVTTNSVLSPAVHVSFIGTTTGLCDGHLETLATALSVQVIVDQTRYTGEPASMPLSLSTYRSAPLPDDAPCAVLATEPIDIIESTTCVPYCLQGAVTQNATNCAQRGRTPHPCTFLYSITLTMCSSGVNTVQWYNISLPDGTPVVNYTTQATQGLLAAGCDLEPSKPGFFIGIPGMLANQNFIVWNTAGLGSTSACTSQMWSLLPTWNGSVIAMDVFSYAMLTEVSVGTVTNTNCTLANSICVASSPSSPSSTAAPLVSSSPTASTGPFSISPSPEPSSSSSSPSFSALPSSPSVSMPPAACTLYCKRDSTYYDNNPADPAWALLSAPHQYCSLDDTLLIDPNNKQVKKTLSTSLLRTALSLEVAMDLNLVGNLARNNATDCTSDLALTSLPLNVSTAYLAIRSRFYNVSAATCNTLLSSLSARSDDANMVEDSVNSTANANATQPEQDDSTQTEHSNSGGGGGGGGGSSNAQLQQWVNALSWFFASYSAVPNCDQLQAAALAQSNTWQNTKHKHSIEPVHLCTSRLDDDSHTCLSVFAYRNPNSECAFVGAGEHNRLIPADVVTQTMGCWTPTQYFAPNVGGSVHDLLNGTFAVQWHCKRYSSRHLTWRLGTRLASDDAPPPQHDHWVYRRADAYWLVDTCKRSTLDYWLNYQCV